MTLDLTQYPEWLLTAFLLLLAALALVITYIRCRKPRNAWLIRDMHRTRSKRHERGGWDIFNH